MHKALNLKVVLQALRKGNRKMSIRITYEVDNTNELSRFSLRRT